MPARKIGDMSFAEYMKALRTHWFLILTLGVLGAVGAFLYAQRLPVLYSSQASVMVIPARGETTVELVQGSNYVQNLVQTYALLASSPVVLDPVIDDLGLAEDSYSLQRRVSVSAPINTVIIEITVTDLSPNGAQDIANGVAASLTTAVDALSPQGENGQTAVRVETIAPARFSGSPVAPNTRLLVAVGLVAGLAVGGAAAIARRVFAGRLTTASDIEEITDIPVLSEVAHIRDRFSLAAEVRSVPTDRTAESLRNLVASLRFVDVDRTRHVLLVTSPSASEGKTSLSLALSVVLADLGNHVLYIEADLRRPSAERQVQLASDVGLTTVLVGDVTLEEAAQAWSVPRLDVLLCGEVPPNPTQLLSGSRIREVLAQARDQYDYVIVDSAPVLPVSDSRWLTSSVDGVLVVTRMNQTKGKALARALDLLSSSPSPILGIVANGTKAGSASPYYSAGDKPSNGHKRKRTSPPSRLAKEPVAPYQRASVSGSDDS